MPVVHKVFSQYALRVISVILVNNLMENNTFFDFGPFFFCLKHSPGGQLPKTLVSLLFDLVVGGGW